MHKKPLGTRVWFKQHIQHSEVHEARNVPGGVTSSKMPLRRNGENIAEVTSSEMTQSWSGENTAEVTSSEVAQGPHGQSIRREWAPLLLKSPAHITLIPPCVLMLRMIDPHTVAVLRPHEGQGETEAPRREVTDVEAVWPRGSGVDSRRGTCTAPVEHGMPLGIQMGNVRSPPHTPRPRMLVGVCYTSSGVWQVSTPVD